MQELFDPTRTGTNTGDEPGTASPGSFHHDDSASLTLLSSAAAVLKPMVSLGDIPPVLELLQSTVAPLTPPPDDGCREGLPAWIQPFPDHLLPTDIDYIRSKDALSIPSRKVRNEILRCYVEYMHPYMPLLDVTELLQLTRLTDDAPTMRKYSLFLFQCVMFSAVVFLDEAVVKEAGYDSLKTMRKVFYQKTRVRTPWVCTFVIRIN